MFVTARSGRVMSLAVRVAWLRHWLWLQRCGRRTGWLLRTLRYECGAGQSARLEDFADAQDEDAALERRLELLERELEGPGAAAGRPPPPAAPALHVLDLQLPLAHTPQRAPVGWQLFVSNRRAHSPPKRHTSLSLMNLN